MLSSADHAPLLAHRFVAIRMDWEQANAYRDGLGVMLGSGRQILLDPEGRALRGPLGRPRVYGRYRRTLSRRVLDRVAARYPVTTDALSIEWFWWAAQPTGRSGGTFPVPADTMAALARLPIAEVRGAVPAALASARFLGCHLRQFVWIRHPDPGPPRLVVRRALDGVPPGCPSVLAVIDPEPLSATQLGHALDAAWLAYMRDRPLTARGYLATPRNRLLRRIAGRLVAEELEIRQRAREGTLLPPGRRLDGATS